MKDKIKEAVDYMFECFEFLDNQVVIGDKKPYDFGGFREEIEAEIKDKFQEIYLQGAKDMRDAVKMNKIDKQNDEDLVSEAINLIVKCVDDSAQQFIDSLEKK